MKTGGRVKVPNTENRTFRMPTRLLRQAKRAADREGRTVNEWVVRACEAALAAPQVNEFIRRAAQGPREGSE